MFFTDDENIEAYGYLKRLISTISNSQTLIGVKSNRNKYLRKKACDRLKQFFDVIFRSIRNRPSR